MVRCTSCRNQLPNESISADTFERCPRCGAFLLVRTYPALYQNPRSANRVSKENVDASDAECFYHVDVPATVACDHCGRFLCNLCDLALDEAHVCAGCLERGNSPEEVTGFRQNVTQYDRIALSISLFTCLVWPFTILSAPYVLYLVKTQYGKRESVIPRSRWRFVVAGVCAVAQLTMWTVLFVIAVQGFLA